MKSYGSFPTVSRNETHNKSFSSIKYSTVLLSLLLVFFLAFLQLDFRNYSSQSITQFKYSTQSRPAGVSILDINIQPISQPLEPVQIIEPIYFEMARTGYDPLVLDDEYKKYFILENYGAVIEPYSSMDLVVDDMNETNVYYKYKVCLLNSPNPDDCEEGILAPTGYPEASLSVNVSCDPYDIYTITVTEYDMTDVRQVLRATETNALCLYVRRELRSLTESDLQATMDAMFALWEYSEEEGQALFGLDFIPNSVLLNFHHFNSVWQDADHIHEGNGFLLQHVKTTNMFEKSMQAVDPSVSLFYWDFTIESANGTALWDSPVFTSEVFGSMPNVTDSWWGFRDCCDDIESAAIPNGRWAYIEAGWNDRYDDLDFGYGYMRAPWSMNPSKYVSRFTSDWQIGTTLPRCSSHYDMLSFTTLMDFLVDAGDDPHSSTHSLIGGMYGCDLYLPLLRENLISDHTGMMTICGKWAFVMKELYRNNLISPKTNCSTIDQDCGFECDLDAQGDILFLLKELISTSVPSSISDHGWSTWVDFLCTGDGFKIVPGDHLESASPGDPSFWPIHPTLERLLHVKLMSGGFENVTWNTDPVNQNICHHASCYESDMNDTAFYPECCYGHYEHDQMLNAVTGNRYEFYGPTNAAVLRELNPTSFDYQMTYIYDSFDWDHCVYDGLDFEDLLYGFYKKYTLGISDDDSTSYSNSTTNSTSPSNSTSSPSTQPSFPSPSMSSDFDETFKPTRSPDQTHKPTYSTTQKPTRSPDQTHKPTTSLNQLSFLSSALTPQPTLTKSSKLTPSPNLGRLTPKPSTSSPSSDSSVLLFPQSHSEKDSGSTLSQSHGMSGDGTMSKS